MTVRNSILMPVFTCYAEILKLIEVGVQQNMETHLRLSDQNCIFQRISCFSLDEFSQIYFTEPSCQEENIENLANKKEGWT